jgi:uncharacterized protein (UPF0371 family)
LEKYGQITVNYNRDVEAFPLLNTLFERILGESPYHSPTDMGVNMNGFCITDDEAARAASNDEIIRRYYAALCDAKKGLIHKDVVAKLELLMSKSGISPADRKAITPALAKSEQTGNPAVAIELSNGAIVTGKTSSLLGAAAACLLNALKVLGGIDDTIELISPTIIEPIQYLKVQHMGSINPRLHTDEVLMALSICAVSDPKAKKAIKQLGNLKNCEVHSTVMLSHTDEKTFKSLGMHLTCEPERQVNLEQI